MVRALEAAPGQIDLAEHSELLTAAIENALLAGRPDEAMALHAELVRRLPRAPATALVEAQIQLAGANSPAAVARLQELRQQRPDFAPALPVLVAALLRTGAVEQALREANALAAADPDAAEPRHLQGLIRTATEHAEGSASRALAVAAALLALAQPMVAHSHLSDALTKVPDDRRLIMALAQLELRTDRPASAMTRAAGLLDAQPGDREARALLADTQMAAGQFAAAAETYAQLWDQEPTATLAAELFSARKSAKQSDARAPLVQWLAAHPDDAGVRMTLAMDLAEDGERPAAIRELERVAGQTGIGAAGRALALNNLAWLYHAQSDRRALETARSAYRAAPPTPAITDTYGWLLAQRRSPCCRALRRACPNHPKSAITMPQPWPAAAIARARACCSPTYCSIPPHSKAGKMHVHCLLSSRRHRTYVRFHDRRHGTTKNLC
jgi:tetratricopeptide (TPR) repeat protein